MRKIDLRLVGGIALAVAAAGVAALLLKRRAEEEAEIFEAYAPQRAKLRLPIPARWRRAAGQTLH